MYLLRICEWKMSLAQFMLCAYFPIFAIEYLLQYFLQSQRTSSWESVASFHLCESMIAIPFKHAKYFIENDCKTA